MTKDNYGCADHGASSQAKEQGLVAERAAGAFDESGRVTLAALLHLLRLMGSELVLTRSQCETGQFETAVRAKIGQFLSPTSDQAAHDAGLAYAKHLMEQVMAQIRAQAQLHKSLKPVPPRKTTAPAAPASSLPRLLN
jgi:hypothetical protein